MDKDTKYIPKGTVSNIASFLVLRCVARQNLYSCQYWIYLTKLTRPQQGKMDVDLDVRSGLGLQKQHS